MSTSTEERIEVRTSPAGYAYRQGFVVEEEQIDKDRKAHFISPVGNTHIWKDGMDTRDVINIAVVGKIELTAICGYTWVPIGSPTKHDTCEECLEIAQQWIGEDGH